MWESSGRDVGALGAGSVAPSEVWGLWERDSSLWAGVGALGAGFVGFVELDLSWLSRFGESSPCCPTRSTAVGSADYDYHYQYYYFYHHYVILNATRIPPHQLKIHRIIGVASSRNLRTFGGSVVWKLAGSELGHFGVLGGSK